jgi:hypothetical protein
MTFELAQKQNKELLQEHAKSSFNFHWLGKNEWLIALFFFNWSNYINLL